jgi:hypothetical protein
MHKVHDLSVAHLAAEDAVFEDLEVKQHMRRRQGLARLVDPSVEAHRFSIPCDVLPELTDPNLTGNAFELPSQQIGSLLNKATFC